MSDPITSTAEQLPLAVVLTCCTCDQTYEPTPEAIARNRLAVPTRTAAAGPSLPR